MYVHNHFEQVDTSYQVVISVLKANVLIEFKLSPTDLLTHR